jgi:hypothetical protein
MYQRRKPGRVEASLRLSFGSACPHSSFVSPNKTETISSVRPRTLSLFITVSQIPVTESETVSGKISTWTVCFLRTILIFYEVN